MPVFTPDEQHLIAVSSQNGSIRCWRTVDGEPLPVPRAWRNPKPVALHSTPDKKLIALCRDNTGKVCTFIDWGGEMHYEMLGDLGWVHTYPRQVRPLGEMPENSPLLSQAMGMIRPSPRLHDLYSGKEWFVHDGLPAYTARTSDDGSVMVTSHGARLELWKLPRRRNQ